MLRKFIKYYKPHKKLFILDTFCSLIVAGCNLFYPYVAGEVVTFAENKLLNSVLIWSAVLLGIFLLKAVCNFVVQYWGHVMGVRMQADMRKDFFSHLQKLPFSFFDENKTGTVMSRIVNDLQDISELAHHGPEDVFLSLITLIGSLVMVCLINPYLALIMLCVVPFMLWFAIKQRLRLKKSFAQMRVETGEVNTTVESAISGVRVSKAYTAESHEKRKFKRANEAFVKARSKAYKSMGIFGSGMGLFSDVMYLVTLVAGGVFLYNEWIDGAGFTSYLLYATSVIAPIRTITAIFESLQSGMTGLQRFNEIMEQPTEEDAPNALDDV
ncbi:MAG: ABC transporter ATP-binding protein, partial [Clostridia bacterium]|nr:ABC transporter ATP-binding protein [Clostridia bacterium]